MSPISSIAPDRQNFRPSTLVSGDEWTRARILVAGDPVKGADAVPGGETLAVGGERGAVVW